MTTTMEMISRTVSGMRTQPPAVQVHANVKPTNVAPIERAVSAAAGTLLFMRGLRRGRVISTLLGGGLLYRAIGGSCPLYSALGMNTAQGGNASTDQMGQRSLPIGKSAGELYDLWTEPQVLRQVMQPLADVSLSGGELHWSMRSSNGQPFEWDGRVTESRPGEFVRWESNPGAALPSDGFIRFRPAPGDWGTDVTLGLHFFPRAGSSTWLSLKGLHPQVAAEKILRRFKSLAETGEVPTLVRQPAARDGGMDKYP